jgi:hypothetical protein
MRGRIWLNSKIISFWKYPTSKTQLNNIVEKLNEKLKEQNLPEISHTWRIDIPITGVDLYNLNRFNMIDDEHAHDQTYDSFRDITSFFIPISQWNPEIVENPIKYLIKNSHKDINKRFKLDKKYSDKVGPSYYLDDIPAFVKHGIERTSDSIIKLKKLVEWADKINLNNEKIYHHSDEDAHAFGYSKNSNKLIIGNPSETHAGSDLDAHADRYTGRLWSKSKVISFWKYPESLSKLKKIIKDINEYIENNSNEIEYAGNKIDSSWKIDIPKFKFNLRKLNILNNQGKINRMSNTNRIYDIKSELVPIFDYTPDMISKSSEFKEKSNEKLYAHLMSPLEKAKKGIKIKSPGFGAEKRYSVKDPSKLGGAYQQGDVPQHVMHQLTRTSDSILKNKPILENKQKDDFKKYIPKLSKFMIENGMKIVPLPKVKIRNNEVKNAESIFGKTAYYDRDLKEITLFTLDRHPKDILRSFAHEMVHHEQNLQGRLNNIVSTNTNEDGHMEKFEKEAYEKGNIMLRNWEDNLKQNKQSLNEIQTEYGCLMLKINFPGWNNFADSYIKGEDLYDNTKHEYGREHEPHCTVLYGFHEDVDVEKIKQIVQSLKNEIIITTDKINVFSTKNFDVVKFEVKSPLLTKLNEIMRKNFKYTSNYNDYNAHMTIGYVKPGLGEKYSKNLNKTISLSSGTFVYSYPGGVKEEFSIKKLNKL